MRSLFAFALFLGTASLAAPQEGRPKTPDEIPPRFGVVFKGKVYSQATPKDALQSAIDAAEKVEFHYLVAHLLDPAFVDARIAERAKQAETAVEANLAALRDFQLKNLDKIAIESRLPVDAAKFRERIVADSKTAAFKQLVRDVQDKFADDPEVLKDLRRFRSQGNFPDMAAGDTAKIGAVDVKERSLFIKKVGDRWYVENKQTEDKAAEPAKEPEKKP